MHLTSLLTESNSSFKIKAFSLVCQHEGDGAVEGHAVVQLILKHIKVVQSIGFSTTAGE